MLFQISDDHTVNFPMASTTLNLDEIYQFAIDVAGGAARMLDEAMLARCGEGPGHMAHIEKDSSVDLVTQADEGKPDPCCSRRLATCSRCRAGHCWQPL